MSDRELSRKPVELVCSDPTGTAWLHARKGDTCMATNLGEHMTLAADPIYISSKEVRLLVWRDVSYWILPVEEVV